MRIPAAPRPSLIATLRIWWYPSTLTEQFCRISMVRDNIWHCLAHVECCKDLIFLCRVRTTKPVKALPPTQGQEHSPSVELSDEDQLESDTSRLKWGVVRRRKTIPHSRSVICNCLHCISHLPDFSTLIACVSVNVLGFPSISHD